MNYKNYMKILKRFIKKIINKIFPICYVCYKRKFKFQCKYYLWEDNEYLPVCKVCRYYHENDIFTTG